MKTELAFIILSLLASFVFPLTFQRPQLFHKPLRLSIDCPEYSYSATAFQNFGTVLDALQLYKEHYGSVDIHSNFVVPQSSSWPPSLRGFRLGKSLTAILSDVKTLQSFPEYEEQLRRLDFDPFRRRMLENWDFVLLALSRYKNLVGDLSVPADFSIPEGDSLWPRQVWGWRLGRQVLSIRTTGSFVNDHPHRRDQLNSMGFCWVESQSKNRNIPNQVNATIASRFKDVLRFLNSDADIQDAVGGKCLSSFKNVPKSLHDFPFAEAARDNMKSGRFFSSVLDVQELLNFAPLWDGQFTFRGPITILFAELLHCFSTYFDLHGSCRISRAFVVPSTGEWPASCRGRNLFTLEQSFRSSLPEEKSGMRTALEQFQVSWEDAPEDFADEDEDESDDTVLRTRVPLHERSKYPLDVTYMHENLRYREWVAKEIIDIKTKRMNVMSPERHKAYFDWKNEPSEVATLLSYQIPPEQREQAEKVGYRFIEFGAFTWDHFVVALELFQKKFGHVDVPYDYTVGDDENDQSYYPSNIIGLELGYFVESIRQGDIDGFDDRHRRSVLDQMNFKWGDMSKHLKFRFLPLIISLRIQHQMGGFDAGGPRFDFKVTKNLPYFPFWLLNAPVGEWYQIAKMQRARLEKYYPDRVAMLNELEFQWWWPFPDDALPRLNQLSSEEGFK